MNNSSLAIDVSTERIGSSSINKSTRYIKSLLIE